MNQELIKTYIQAYKSQFAEISKQELYKWQAVKQFQDNWDIDAPDFYAMLSVALSQTFNLLDSGLYYPKRMLLESAKTQPETVRALFKELYNEDKDLFERIEHLRTVIKKIVQDNFEVKNDYQDHRAILVYLVLKYPERYFFYKFGMFKDFVAKIDYPYQPKKGRIENISHFENLCQNILHLVSQDQDLLRLHNARLTDDCYIDESLYILTQDFIYAVANHLQEEQMQSIEDVKEIDIQTKPALDISVNTSIVNFNPSITNYIQNNKENKRIGDLGELFVVQFERDKLKKVNKPKLAKKVAHHAKDKGDGLGYDVYSFDENGNEMFIEVKATKGNKNTPFYITRNELERSKQEQDNFFVYRVYNFNDEKGKGDVLIIQGDVSCLCIEPINYKVKMN